jgi:hypothetical protein
MRTVRRPRHYVSRQWLALLRPLFRYSTTRDAYVLRGVGHHAGPVLRLERRRQHRAGRAFDGVERRARTA